MNCDYSPEEAPREDINKLGKKLGPVFNYLLNDFAWLQIKWQEYRELYGTKPERIDILNSSAGLFFRVVQITMWEDTLLHLSRLTDNVSVGGKKNMTIRRLPDVCENETLRTSIQALVDNALAATAFARDWRNRHVGHCDLDLVLNSDAKPLAPASRADVNNAISAIHAVLNHINEQLLKSTLLNKTISRSGGAIELLYILRDGLDTEHAREERLRSGQPDPDDYIPRDI